MIVWGAREHHRFEAAGKPFVYLVPSAAIFELDDAADAVLRTLSERPQTRDELAVLMGSMGSDTGSDTVSDPAGGLDAALAELARVQAIGQVDTKAPPTPKVIPLAPFPLTTMVLNVTNQCNLSCEYCYEYGEDKIVDTEHGKQSKFMSEATARQSVEFLLKESARIAHMTFFGGETLLNFPVLKSTVA